MSFFDLVNAALPQAAHAEVYYLQHVPPVTPSPRPLADPDSFSVSRKRFVLGDQIKLSILARNTEVDCNADLCYTGFGDYFGRVCGYITNIPPVWYKELLGDPRPGQLPIDVIYFPLPGRPFLTHEFHPGSGIYHFRRDDLEESRGAVLIVQAPYRSGLYAVARCTEGIPREVDTDPLRLAFMKWASVKMQDVRLPPWGEYTIQCRALTARAFPYVSANHPQLEQMPGYNSNSPHNM